MRTYYIIGMMSGTSLDGVDLAYCKFEKSEVWNYQILKTKHIPYSIAWKEKLSQAFHQNEQQLALLSLEYGKYLGKLALEFITTHQLRPDYIASHGHTIFHKPDEYYTLQIGDGREIASITQTPVIYDFRIGDVKLGGQGAPLVPIGDQLLFGTYDYCLNLGGFANISTEKNGSRLAFDVCPVNIVINHLAAHYNKSMDYNGELAKHGKIIPELLITLNTLPYYQLKAPKSLGREWVESQIFPLINSYENTSDVLRTFYEHIITQLRSGIKSEKSVLITGGGAHNEFLLKLLDQSGVDFIKASNELIDFKEALIFAFLGVLRVRNEINCLSSVTGAKSDSCGGILIKP